MQGVPGSGLECLPGGQTAGLCRSAQPADVTQRLEPGLFGEADQAQLLALLTPSFALVAAIRSVFHSGNHDPNAPQGDSGAARRVIKTPRFLNLSGVSHRRGGKFAYMLT
nr:MAG TPA: hypothetical protein [Caudoviricetes sp.]